MTHTPAKTGHMSVGSINISEADGRTDSQTDTTDRFTLPANVVVNNAQAGGFIARIAGSISIVLL